MWAHQHRTGVCWNRQNENLSPMCICSCETKRIRMVVMDLFEENTSEKKEEKTRGETKIPYEYMYTTTHNVATDVKSTAERLR
jgi:hypothetical protein